MKSIRVILFVCLVCGWFGFASAKTVKPTLLVYGHGIEAFVAAIQGARSNVPTVWIVDSKDLVPELTSKPLKITSNNHLDGGIWMDLLMTVAQSKVSNDSLAVVVKNDINPRLMANAIEKMWKNEKNLTVLWDTDVESLSRSKNNWKVNLRNKQKYTVRAIVDASAGGRLKDKMEKSLSESVSPKTMDHLELEHIRTTVAVGEHNRQYYTVLFKDVVSQSMDNVFFTQGLVSKYTDEEGIPFRAHVSQAIGAAAAYCAFFKVASDKVEVRKLQTELMAFGARLMLWENVTVRDPQFATLQKSYLATFLGRKSDYVEHTFYKDDTVSVEDVKVIFNQLYTRSQLWFLDNEVTYFTLKDALSLIKIVSFRGNEIDAQIQKDWSKKLYFDGDFDLEKLITKYEFAVLVEKYATPYAKAVTAEGIILR